MNVQDLYDLQMTGNDYTDPNGNHFFASASSSSDNQHQPYKAFDGSVDDDCWQPSSGVPQWLQLQLPDPMRIFKFRISNRTAHTEHPTAITFQCSENGAEWFEIDKFQWTESGQGLSKVCEVEEYYGGYRYFRWTFTAASTLASVSEIAILNAAESLVIPPSYLKLKITENKGANVLQFADLNFYDENNDRIKYPVGTKCRVDMTTYSGEGPMNILDNDSSTKVCGDFGVLGAEFTITMYGDTFCKAMRKYDFCTANDAYQRDPKSWTLECSLDGVDYVEVDKRINETITNNRRTLTQKWDCKLKKYKALGTAVYTIQNYVKGGNDVLIWVSELTRQDTSIKLYTKVDGGAYAEATNGGDIPGLPDGPCTLSIKAELETEADWKTPKLDKILVRSDTDKKVLMLTSAIPNFSSAIGNITVSYDGHGGLRGEGGNAAAFTGTFTPTNLTWKGHQNDEEHIEVDIDADVDLIAIVYRNTKEDEHIELTLSAAIALIDIHDL